MSTVSKKMPVKSEDKKKKESLERLINQYQQALANNDTDSVKKLKLILIKLEYLKR